MNFQAINPGLGVIWIGHAIMKSVPSRYPIFAKQTHFRRSPQPN